MFDDQSKADQLSPYWLFTCFTAVNSVSRSIKARDLFFDDRLKAVTQWLSVSCSEIDQSSTAGKDCDRLWAVRRSTKVVLKDCDRLRAVRRSTKVVLKDCELFGDQPKLYWKPWLTVSCSEINQTQSCRVCVGSSNRLSLQSSDEETKARAIVCLCI